MHREEEKPNTVCDYVESVSYADDDSYRPSEFALAFVIFIKAVNGDEGEENKTPVLHYKMLDQIAGPEKDIVNMLFRGAAKTTVFGEYLFLFIAVYGEIPGFGKIDLALYVSDSIENGVKNMRKNLEFRRENSDFLMTYIPKVKFTDVRWEFINADGVVFIVKGYGAKTGVRGAKEQGTRPKLAILDDLIDDEDARSETVIASINNVVYKAIEHALHPKLKKTIWSGTPFNARDPLYEAVESGAWTVNVYPVCEKFPCTREEFRSAWPDRFDYDFVYASYTKSLKAGKVDAFNQELMLTILSDDDRMILDCDISWFDRRAAMENRGSFNYYITTDFATSENQAADFSVIFVWAYSSNGDWLLMDMVVKRQEMDANINDLFRLAQEWQPLEVGIEIGGQQKGFIAWIKSQMIVRNVYFNLAKSGSGNSKQEGLQPVGDKFVRFKLMQPQFKLNKILLPLERKESPEVVEILSELEKVSIYGIKSKKDDCLDGISQLNMLKPIKPGKSTYILSAQETSHGTNIWGYSQDTEEDDNRLDSYIP